MPMDDTIIFLVSHDLRAHVTPHSIILEVQGHQLIISLENWKKLLKKLSLIAPTHTN